MRIAGLILSLAAMTACAAQPTLPAAPSATGAERCVWAAGVSGRYVLPPDSIMFEMLGPVNYRNVLARACPGLTRLGGSATIVFESSMGGQICAGDRVRLSDARDSGPNRLAGAQTCELGPFVPSTR